MFEKDKFDYYYLIANTGMINSKLEFIISQDPMLSYSYARNILHDRFILGEPTIGSDSFYSYFYMLYIVKGIWKLGEQSISIDDEFSYYYARHRKSRFALGEKVIVKNKCYILNYMVYAMMYNHE